MARIRTIKPEFWTSEQIVECSPNARLLFVGMWNFCDDAGIHPRNAKRLKMEVFPGDDFSVEQIESLVEELIAAELVFAYDVDSTLYLQVTGFTKHQRIDQPTYRFPHPDGAVPSGPLRRRSQGVRRTDAERSQSVRTRKGMEGNRNGMERNNGASTRGESDSAGTRAKPGTLGVWIEYGLVYAESKSKTTTRDKLEESFNHYEANGWKQNNGRPIKDWKAACRGSVQRHDSWNKQATGDDWGHVRDTIKRKYSPDVRNVSDVQSVLTDAQFTAAKAIGLREIVFSDDFEAAKLGKRYLQELTQ